MKTGDDEDRVIESILSRPVSASIFIPGLETPVKIDVPDFVIEQFVARLNIRWRLEKTLSQIINKRFADENQLKIKVSFRNARPIPEKAGSRLLYRYLELIDPVHRDLFPCLDLILSFMDEIMDDLNLYDFLVEKKRACFQSLKKAEKFERLTAKTNMETLMMMGVRAPHTPKTDLKRKMRLIDTICRVVFSRAEFFQTAFEHHHQDQLCPETDMEKIVNVLS